MDSDPDSGAAKLLNKMLARAMHVLYVYLFTHSHVYVSVGF